MFLKQSFTGTAGPDKYARGLIAKHSYLGVILSCYIGQLNNVVIFSNKFEFNIDATYNL
jgi:hypothetical protein